MLSFCLRLPALILKFWYLEAPKGLLLFFGSLNHAFFQLFSLALLIKTYFKPWKNEYREGLVGFSIGMGIFIKTFIILADLILFVGLLFFEILLFLSFILFPISVVFSLIY
ncbi:MAG: hypothetical protein Q8P10_00855 [bacterium]|nr:hypothetical protein [bacterium]